jgi:hypothetical protein
MSKASALMEAFHRLCQGNVGQNLVSSILTEALEIFPTLNYPFGRVTVCLDMGRWGEHGWCERG